MEILHINGETQQDAKQPAEWEKAFAATEPGTGEHPPFSCVPSAVACHEREAEARGGRAGRQLGDETQPASKEGGKSQAQEDAGPSIYLPGGLWRLQELCCGKEGPDHAHRPAPTHPWQPSLGSKSCRAESFLTSKSCKRD